MLFSTRVTHKTPQELIREYQQEFVNQRVNKEQYLQTITNLMSIRSDGAQSRIQKMVEAGMRGEILPQKISKQHMAMGGALMNLPEDEFKGQPLEAFKHDSKLLKQAYDVFFRAYKQCNGDMNIYAQNLKKQRVAPNKLAQSALKINKAADTNTSCGKSTGGMCSSEQNNLELISHKSAALQASLKAQPELYNCTPVKTASQKLMKRVMEDGQERIKAVRYIEAFRDEDSGLTNVTAVWSNSSFKSKNMMVDKYGYPKNTIIRGDLPLCPGCQRTWNFGGNGHEESFTQDMMTSSNTVGSVSDFYIKAMVKKGWKLVDSDRKAHELMQEDRVVTNRRYLRFARGEKHMTLKIGVNSHSNKTEVFSTRSD